MAFFEPKNTPSYVSRRGDFRHTFSASETDFSFLPGGRFLGLSPPALETAPVGPADPNINQAWEPVL